LSTTSPKWRLSSGGWIRVEEGHVVADPASQLELDEPSVEGQRLVQVTDLQRDVVDADQAGHGDVGPEYP
jgi:hypothetical protein